MVVPAAAQVYEAGRGYYMSGSLLGVPLSSTSSRGRY